MAEDSEKLDGLVDPPNDFAPLAIWEQYLTWVQQADNLDPSLKAHLLEEAEATVALKRKAQVRRASEPKKK